MGEKEFRNKTTAFSFFFSILVVWAHSYNGELFLGKTPQGKAVLEIEHVMGDRIGQIAVPGFFLLSAYLFYRNFGWNKLLPKWRSRLQSVLLPYFLWNGIYYLGYVIGSRLPLVSKAMGKGKIPIAPDVFFDALLNYRYLHTFWYMKQLILMIMLAPLFYLFLKQLWSGLLFLAVMFFMIWTARDVFPYINEDAVFYYGSGAFLALHGRQLEKPAGRKRFWAGLGLTGIALVNFYLTSRYSLPGTTVACRLLMMLGLWLLAGDKLPVSVRPWMECNFFLYAVHFAVIRLINKSFALVLPPHPAFPLLLYLLMPAVAVGISYGLSLILRQFTPGLWRVLNGGR